MGDMIRVPMPALTEERRKELIKVVHKRRRERAGSRCATCGATPTTHLKELLKKKEVAEDDERRAQDDVQKLTDRHIAEIDKLLQAKEADLHGGLRP